VTHPNLEGVRDAVKNAALQSGCAFWDMYEAMGGRNSMPSWVFADPSLAVSDFVHFNTRGARLIAEMLYNAIMYEYQEWKD
jgi:lysophospholipase L1-like esterase